MAQIWSNNAFDSLLSRSALAASLSSQISPFYSNYPAIFSVLFQRILTWWVSLLGVTAITPEAFCFLAAENFEVKQQNHFYHIIIAWHDRVACYLENTLSLIQDNRQSNLPITKTAYWLTKCVKRAKLKLYQEVKCCYLECWYSYLQSTSRSYQQQAWLRRHVIHLYMSLWRSQSFR